MADIEALLTSLQKSLKILQDQQESSAGNIEPDVLKQIEKILNRLVENVSGSQESTSRVVMDNIVGSDIQNPKIAGRDVIEIQKILLQAGDVIGSQKIEDLLGKLDTLVQVLNTKFADEDIHSRYPEPPRILPIRFADLIKEPGQGDDISSSGHNKRSSSLSEPEQVIDPMQFDSHLNDLGNLLQAKKWKEADQETIEAILTIARDHDEGVLVGGLRTQDINNFPCSVLQLIDELWNDASDGKFGLSIQRQIWYDIARQEDIFVRKQFTKKFRKFGDRVGWRVNGQWLESYEMLTFTLDAPQGHLPSFRLPAFEREIGVMASWQNNFRLLLSRLERCASQDHNKGNNLME